MNHTEAVKCILKRAGLTYADVAAKLGKRSISTVSMRINRESARLCNIAEILDAAGYEMVAMPKTDVPLSEEAFVLRKEDYT